MIRTAFKSITVIAGFMLLGSSVLHADSLGPSNDRRHKPTRPSVTTYATGLTNPRGLTFGPDGKLYVAEAGTGGTLTPKGGTECPIDINVLSPYTAGFSGRVVRVRRDGKKEAVAKNLPSMTDNTGASYGPTDLAFIGQTLYVLIEMGGCSHATNPPHFIKDTNPATTDQEPGGVFHSMIAIANLIRFDRRTGKRTKVLTGFATFPNGLVEGPDGALYTSNQGISFAPGDGEILRIVP